MAYEIDDWRDVRVHRSYVLWGIVLLLLISVLFTSVYTVQAESQGVMLRFGKYIKYGLC